MYVRLKLIKISDNWLFFSFQGTVLLSVRNEIDYDYGNKRIEKMEK